MAVPYPVPYTKHHLLNSGAGTSIPLESRPMDDIHDILRTPSPTASEFNLLNGIKEKRSTKDNISELILYPTL
jgi:predicted DNA-binding ribbon-helix-helix protein